jgi:hypothetical protein
LGYGLAQNLISQYNMSIAEATRLSQALHQQQLGEESLCAS